MRFMDVRVLKNPDYFVQTELDRLRVNIGFAGTEKKIIMFTSCVPNEGKSYISVNIWNDLAKSGKRVCFIDADMRKSALRSTLQLAPAEGEFLGLSHYLSGQAELEDVLYATAQENAFLIPTTTLVNPSLLLEEDSFVELLHKLRSEFDYIILDTPPLGLVADGQKIASYSDGAVLVIRAHSTKRDAVRSGSFQLQQVNCPLLGTVLNRLENGKIRGYYSKYSYSHSYYQKGYYYYSNKNADKTPKIGKGESRRNKG